MRLLTEVCRENRLPAIVNIHDVVLAQQFTDRIMGLRAGRVVFDGQPGQLTQSVLAALAYLVVGVGSLEMNWTRVAEGIERGGLSSRVS